MINNIFVTKSRYFYFNNRKCGLYFGYFGHKNVRIVSLRLVFISPFFKCHENLAPIYEQYIPIPIVSKIISNQKRFNNDIFSEINNLKMSLTPIFSFPSTDGVSSFGSVLRVLSCWI
jgi:hypothetical protein